jgi:hypothetical protein
MAMNNSPNAVNKNVIIPEVYAELVNEKIAGHVVVIQAADVLGDLQGQPGETINIPRWKYPGDASDVTVGDAMTTQQLEQSNQQATIKMVASPGIAINDYDNEVALGRALEKAAEMQAIGIARKQDADIISEAYGCPLKQKLATNGEITFAELNSALGKFGDDANADDFAFIAIHSTFVPSFLAMDGFVDATKTFTKEGSGVQLNNLLGYFRGIPVVVTDRCYDTTSAEAFILLIKKHALAFIPKESVFVEASRNAAKRETDMFTSQYYACALTDESGVVLAKYTLPVLGSV